MTADELKAIAERHESRKRMGFTHEERQSHKDVATLLSFIPDVVRACAGVAESLSGKLPDGYNNERGFSNPCCYNAWNEAASTAKIKILSILDHPIKSESEIRRNTAREIVELALQKLYGPHQPPTLQSFIASIRSTYGLTTHTEEGAT